MYVHVHIHMYANVSMYMCITHVAFAITYLPRQTISVAWLRNHKCSNKVCIANIVRKHRAINYCYMYKYMLGTKHSQLLIPIRSSSPPRTQAMYSISTSGILINILTSVVSCSTVHMCVCVCVCAYIH